METIAEVVSHNMRALRKKQHLTQAQLAERSGLSTTTVQQIERGEVWLGKPTIEALSKGFGVSEVALFQADPLEHTPAQCAAALHAFHSKPEGQTLYQTRAAEIPADITAALVKIAGEPLLLDAVRAQLKIKPANPDVEIFSADQSSTGSPSKSKKA